MKPIRRSEVHSVNDVEPGAGLRRVAENSYQYAVEGN